jgi:hypothetical protein
MPSSSRSAVQLRAMLRKNVILIKRNRRDVLAETLWPIVFLFLLVLMRKAIPNKVNEEVLVSCVFDRV